MGPQASAMRTDSGYRLDEIDRRVIHALMADARNTSGPMIAEEVNVSPGTIRNRINQLEEEEIIIGYHAQIDFERSDGALMNLFICNAPFENREVIAQQIQQLPAVINVRELMGGRMNLHVLAVSQNTDEIRQIGRSLVALGIEIEDEVLVHNEIFAPYGPFSPDDDRQHSPTNFINLAGDAEAVELTVRTDALIAGLTLEEAGQQDLLASEVLVISIERDGEVLTPHGDTEIRPDDIVTVFSRDRIDEKTMHAFLDDDIS